MSVCGDDFLEFANKCLSCEDEINYRNFLSRGYYGMYHKISSKLIYKPNFYNSQHAGLIDYLKDPSQNKNEPYEKSKLKSLSYILEQERLNRVKADYHITEDIHKLQVETARKMHAKFNGIVDEL